MAALISSLMCGDNGASRASAEATAVPDRGQAPRSPQLGPVPTRLMSWWRGTRIDAPANMAPNFRFGLAVAFWSMVVAGMAAQPPVNPKAAMMKEFRDRAESYLALHKKIADELPPLKETSDPQKIADREKLLGVNIGKARANARSGEIFGDIAPLVVKTIRADLRHRARADRKAVFAEMPARVPPLGINSIYPSTVPLITFPPALLQALPPLPEGLEYRFYGHDLILRDMKANIVADVLRNIVPM
jgi:hypothetical protein